MSTKGLSSSAFEFPGQLKVYHGKVRDVYTLANGLLVMVASDRISAFDHVLPRPIPYKGQVLNQIAGYFLEATRDIVPNWVISQPDPNVTIGHACETYPIELVVRGYLAGHAARTYRTGARVLSGVALPDGLHEGDALPMPIITPTTKAHEGHDEDISKEEIIAQGLVSAEDLEQIYTYAIRLFERGSAMARERGLILVDTKYEFGKKDGHIYLIDEVHTPDSSRYYLLEGYDERQQNGKPQLQLSKEFVREWLIEHQFMGKPGQQMPAMPDDFVNLVTERYIELYEKITGRTFDRVPLEGMQERIERNVLESLK